MFTYLFNLKEIFKKRPHMIRGQYTDRHMTYTPSRWLSNESTHTCTIETTHTHTHTQVHDLMHAQLSVIHNFQ